MRALLGQGSGLVWELSLGSDCHLREQGGPHSQDVFGNVHGSGKKGRKKMNSSLWFGCLDDGSSKQRTTQTSNPVGWKEERMGRSGKQNWKDTWGFRHLILIWVGNHFFPHLQEILRTRAGYWLRTPYNLTQFWHCLPRAMSGPIGAESSPVRPSPTADSSHKSKSSPVGLWISGSKDPPPAPNPHLWLICYSGSQTLQRHFTY